MTNKQIHNASQTIRKQTRNLTLVLCMGMLAGVLIWAKLRLVTDIPRSAYAEPNEAKLIHDQALESEHEDASDPADPESKTDESEDDSSDSTPNSHP